MDMGCGLGIDVWKVAVALSEVPILPSKVVGVDFNTQMIEYASTSSPEVRGRLCTS